MFVPPPKPHRIVQSTTISSAYSKYYGLTVHKCLVRLFAAVPFFWYSWTTGNPPAKKPKENSTEKVKFLYMSFYYSKSQQVWLPMYSGRKQSRFIYRQNGEKHYLPAAAAAAATTECPNTLCMDVCPMCCPLQPEPKIMPKTHIVTPDEAHRASKYDHLAISSDGKQYIGMWSSVAKHLAVFQNPKPVPEPDIALKLPCTFVIPEPISIPCDGNLHFIAGKYTAKVISRRYESDWANIWQRIHDILLHNILSINHEEDTVKYSFGTFPLSIICVLTNLPANEFHVIEDHIF